jgi:hypothetical protein
MGFVKLKLPSKNFITAQNTKKLFKMSELIFVVVQQELPRGAEYGLLQIIGDGKSLEEQLVTSSDQFGCNKSFNNYFTIEV